MLDIDKISPGVRKLVQWLNENGHKTTDSGDGSNFEDGMECAVSYPMISILSDPEGLSEHADLLYRQLCILGVNFGPDEESPMIQASYDPYNKIAILLLVNLVDADIKGLQ